MEESLYSYIDPGIIHFMAYPDTIDGEGPILETLKKIAIDDYFTSVEITTIKDDETRKEAKKILDSSHLNVYYGAQPRLLIPDLDVNSADDQERKEAVEILKDSVDEAIEMGAEAVAFLSGKDVADEKREAAIDRLVDSINQVCEYARKQDDELGVVLEIFDYDVDKEALVGPAVIAKEVAEKVRRNYNNFGLMVDLSHLPLLRETPRQALGPIADYLVHVHIGNGVMDESSPVYGDSHPRFGLPEGENDVQELVEFLRALMDIGYLDGRESRTVSFEVQPSEGESSEVVIANAKRVLKKAWAQL